MKNIFDTEFNIGASSPEPTIRKMIETYYTHHGINQEQAEAWADEVIKSALASVGEK